MKIRSIVISFAVVFGCALNAEANFHLFDIQEVFSNADGSVLFVELFTASGGQQFLGGHSFTFEISAIIQQTLNLSNLPSDTTNKTFLIGTSNLTALYGITPDFVIPANFFAAGANNTVNFGPGQDRVNLALLPTDGVSSLNGLISNDGNTSAATSINSQATPKNFAGQTVTIPETSVNFLLLTGIGALAFARRRS